MGIVGAIAETLYLLSLGLKTAVHGLRGCYFFFTFLLKRDLFTELSVITLFK